MRQGILLLNSPTITFNTLVRYPLKWVQNTHCTSYVYYALWYGIKCSPKMLVETERTS